MRGVRRRLRELAVAVVAEDLGLRVERRRRVRRCQRELERRHLVGRRFRERVRRPLEGGRRLVGRRCRVVRRGGRAGLGRRHCRELAVRCHLR
jgi:hypothetical protein